MKSLKQLKIRERNILRKIYIQKKQILAREKAQIQELLKSKGYSDYDIWRITEKK